MGINSSSRHKNEESDIEAREQFHFRFTDCSCKCDSKKRRLKDLYNQNDSPQTAILTALITQISRPEYDISKMFLIFLIINIHKLLSDCHCDCGEGVKFGFIFGNMANNTQSQSTNNHTE